MPGMAARFAIVGQDQPIDTVRRAVAEELAKLHAMDGVAQEIQDAAHADLANEFEAIIWRLSAAVSARDETYRSPAESANRDEVELPNGFKVTRDERDALRDALEQFGRRTRDKPSH